jgi:arginyl-tRNA--protein-N-Asp/Glu arginylyltransferase
MKIFFSEHNKDYSSYTFDYAVYALMDVQNELPSIYAQGFLPYSNDLSETREIFYLSRSLRVNLDEFTDSSENRRVQKKLTELDLQLQVTKKEDFDLNDKHFRQLCLSYASSRFSGQAMTEERFEHILQRKVLTDIFTFSNAAGTPVAYIFTLIESGTLHYWFSFFDERYLENYPIGKWLMWRAIDWAKQAGLEYVYLGTCYGEKALYKVRDFKALRFWDGSVWNRDIKLLKLWCKTDEEKLSADRFKLK